jgi:hypothetical protein
MGTVRRVSTDSGQSGELSERHAARVSPPRGRGKQEDASRPGGFAFCLTPEAPAESRRRRLALVVPSNAPLGACF